MSNFDLLKVCDSFLNETDHAQLLAKAEDSFFEINKQHKQNHYEHVFQSYATHLSQHNEAYRAEFHENKSKDLDKYLLDVFLPCATRELKRLYPNLRYVMRPFIHKLSSGSFYRSHLDNYAGVCGYTYFLNRHWMWDYGGILRFYSEKNLDSFSIFPKSNRIVIRDEKERLFHDVSIVSKHAKNDQYLILGWAGIEKPTNPKYTYIDIDQL